MKKRLLLFIASIMLLGSLFSFAFTGIASAHGVAVSHSTQSSKQAISKPNISRTFCSDSGALQLWFYDYFFEQCFTQPGVRTTIFSSMDEVYAGNWSGYLRFIDGSSLQFCDHRTYYLSGTVYQIEISPTRLSGC